MNGNTLTHTNEEKDLGVIMDLDLKFHKQSASAILEYGNIILGPFFKEDAKLVEKVQR